MIKSIKAEKAFDKIQHPFMTKMLSKMGIKGTYLNIIKAVYMIIPQPTQWASSTSVSLEIRNKAGMSTCTSLIQHSTGSPSHSNQTKRRNNGIQIEKEEVKLSLFADDMILNIEYPKDSIRKLLELIDEFSKVAGCKINIQKSVAFLYANNELSERETY